MTEDLNAPQISYAGVDRFQLAYGHNGVVIAVGAPRPVITRDGFLDAKAANYFLALGMSPQTAKQLRDLVADFVDRYEAQYGAIQTLAKPLVSNEPPQDNVTSIFDQFKVDYTFGDSVKRAMASRPMTYADLSGQGEGVQSAAALPCPKCDGHGRYDDGEKAVWCDCPAGIALQPPSLDDMF